MHQLRLVEGENATSGRAEQYLDDNWKPFCTPGYDLTFTAQLVCRELGLSFSKGDFLNIKLIKTLLEITLLMKDILETYLHCIFNITKKYLPRLYNNKKIMFGLSCGIHG